MTDQPIQPIIILPEGATRNRGREAHRNNIDAAKLVAETIRTTLGPKGMDKMIVDSMGDITVTNDGVTILEEMEVSHPAAKLMVEVARTQEQEIGDGTTTAVILAGELLKKAEEMLDMNIHPTVIARGYRVAAEKASSIYRKLARPIDKGDEKTLTMVAMTAMTGKGSESAKEHLAALAVKAVRQVMEEDGKTRRVDKSSVKIEKTVGGSSDETELIEGVVLDKEMLGSAGKRKEHAKITLLDCPLEVRSTETDAKIQINDPSQITAFLNQEEAMLRTMVGKVAESGANVVFCQKGIDDLAQHFLAKQGILAVRRIKRSDMEQLSRATGASIVSHLDDLAAEDLGSAGLVEERRIGSEPFVFVERCRDPKAVTILVKGGTEHVVDEIRRALEDAIGDLSSVLVQGKAVGGAGSGEIAVAEELQKASKAFSGKEQIAIKAFAEALEIIPKTLAENAGLDPIDMLTELKAAHEEGRLWQGIDVQEGRPFDAWKAGIIEPLQIKTQAVSSATEVANLILRIDDVIVAKKAAAEPRPGGFPDA